MKILYFNNGSGLGTAKSGGTARHIEIVKRFEKMKTCQYIVTTLGAKHLYEEENIKSRIFLVKASLFKKVEKNNFDRIIAYFISTIHSLVIAGRLPKAEIVYSPSDYFCDVLPAIFYKLLNKKTKMVVMIHHKCRSPFVRQGNFLINLLSYFSQLVNFVLIKIFADKILLYETPEGEKIGDYFINIGFRRKDVNFVHNGVDVALTQSIEVKSKKYEACFAGGLRASKGIFDLIPIWKNVVKDYGEKAKIIVAGGGTEKITRDFKERIEKSGLEKNILLVGALDKVKLYKLMKRSQIFVSTSHEEGWGIAICEALACGLPVVAFDLPSFKIFKRLINKIPPYNHKKFSEKILEILKAYPEKHSQVEKRKKFISKFDWDRVAERDYSTFLKICR